MALLQPISMQGNVFNIKDKDKYKKALKLLNESINGCPIFIADNLITWNRNLSFLRDDYFLDYLNNKNNNDVVKSTIWRLYILLYFAEIAAKIDGDFMELGVLQGNTVAEVIKKVDFEKLQKKYYLYDLFEWKEGDKHPPLNALKDPLLYEKVCDRFTNSSFIQIIKGSIPQSFNEVFPKKICFAHIDMNQAEPEGSALERILPKLSKNGIIIFDDYGWWSYSEQKQHLDSIVKRFNLKILELPTGQGLLINS